MILVIFCVWYTILPLIRLSNLDEMLVYKNINKTVFIAQNSSTFLPKDHQLSYQRTNHDLKFDFPIIWIYTNIVKRYLKCFWYWDTFWITINHVNINYNSPHMMKTWNYHLNPMRISLRQYFLIVDKMYNLSRSLFYNSVFLNNLCEGVP